MFIFIMSIFGSGVITSHDQYIVITKWDDPPKFYIPETRHAH
jgi:hypothetical protein